MILKLESLHLLDLLDAKEKVKTYDCKTDKVVYGIGRWEYVVCDDELFDSIKAELSLTLVLNMKIVLLI